MKWALHAFYEMNDGPRRSLRKLLGTLDCQHVSRDRNVDDGRLNSRQVDVDVDLRGRFHKVDGRSPLAVGCPQSDGVECPASLLQGGVHPALEFPTQSFDRL